MPRVSSPKRGEVSRVKKIGKRSAQENKGGRVAEESRERRGMEKRGGMPKRPGTLFRGRLRCCCRTTIAQKLDKDFFTVFISSFQ